MAGVNSTDVGLSGYTSPTTGAGMPMGANYQLPAQNYQDKGSFWLAPNQYTPTGNTREQLSQSIAPTSQNVRNLELSTLLQRMNTPMESLYAGQFGDAAAQGYAQSQGNLASTMAQRGLTGSGVAQGASRANTGAYLQNVGEGVQQARQLEDQRRTQNLNSLLGIGTQDINFYNLMRGGQGAYGGPATANYGWPQTAGGIAAVVKELIAAAAGGVTSGAAGVDAGTGGGGGMSGLFGSSGDIGGQSGIFNNPSATVGATGTGFNWQGALQGYMGGGGIGGVISNYLGGGGGGGIGGYLGGY